MSELQIAGLLLLAALILWALGRRLHSPGRCGNCGHIGETWRGACCECLGELTEGLRDERQRVVKEGKQV